MCFNNSDLARVAESLARAARRLDVSVPTVRRLLAKGELSRVQIGRAVRVLSRSVDELAERGGVNRAK
jgi:excisionase family DNA binding protein